MILTIPRKASNGLNEIAALGRGGTVFATDFYVDGAETWTRVAGGLREPGGVVVNVDHHAPLHSMQRRITSTMLAIERMKAGLAPDPAQDVVVVNHMDCDSVLASGILSRRLDPHPDLVEASLAADHTGEAHPVADLLQGLDAHWSRSGLPTPSIEGLDRFSALLRELRGSGTIDDPFAREALARRRQNREAAERMVAEGRFDGSDGVSMAVLDEPVEGELFLPHLPRATLVVTMTPLVAHPGRWQAKIRLGHGASEGLSLHDLRIAEFDDAYGGRWNAGSNNRGDGTDLTPDAYRRKLIEALAATRLRPGRNALQ